MAGSPFSGDSQNGKADYFFTRSIMKPDLCELFRGLIGTGYCFIGTNSVDRNGEDFSVMRDQVTSWRRDCSPKRLLNGV